MNQEVQNQARQRQAQLIDEIIATRPFMTREGLEEEFTMWDIEEYQLLIASGLLDPLMRAHEDDDNVAREQRVQDFLKELRMWRKFLYHGISPNMLGGNAGHEDPRIAELRARITELENENTALRESQAATQAKLANKDGDFAEQEDAWAQIETREAEHAAKVKELAQKAHILAKNAEAVEHQAIFIKLRREVGRGNEETMAKAYDLLGKAVEDMNDIAAGLTDEAGAPGAEPVELE
ncbi:hypothetical protein N0V85_005915 [Neurospora sp. IMI 360204]|nr:hypothetical protein N0V85_005915 [Neurospora sp. IMI 360204]